MITRNSILRELLEQIEDMDADEIRQHIVAVLDGPENDISDMDDFRNRLDDELQAAYGNTVSSTYRQFVQFNRRTGESSLKDGVTIEDVTDTFRDYTLGDLGLAYRKLCAEFAGKLDDKMMAAIREEVILEFDFTPDLDDLIDE